MYDIFFLQSIDGLILGVDFEKALIGFLGILSKKHSGNSTLGMNLLNG